MARTLYDILEVSKTASPEVIRNAYRAFKIVARAYEILSNPEKRAQYDSRILHGEEDLFLGIVDSSTDSNAETVKRLDGSNTWCTIDEHIRRKGMELSKTNLQGICLGNLSLEGSQLDGSDLSYATLENVILKNANLADVICKNGNFKNVDFSTAILNDSNFNNCVFQNCKFDNCTISKASFLSSDFRGSSFFNVTLNEVDYSNSIFEEVLFSRGRTDSDDDYYYQVITNRIVKCIFFRCNLRRAIFGNHVIKIDKKKEIKYMAISFKNTDMTGANMTEAIFERSCFEECNFTDACLTSTILKNSKIINPLSFKGASLYGADFTKATLKNIDFSTCNVINTRFHESKMEDLIFPEGFEPPASSILINEQKIENKSTKDFSETAFMTITFIAILLFMIIGGAIILFYID